MTVEQFFSNPDKWTKGQMVDPRTGARCLAGAIDYCYDFDFVNYAYKQGMRKSEEIRQRVLAALRRHGENWLAISDFNDDPNTTFESMMEVVREEKI